MITPENLVEFTLFKDTPSSLILSLTFSTTLELVNLESLKTKNKKRKEKFQTSENHPAFCL